MKIESFLEHHGVTSNPFVDEDAQTDLVFKKHCISGARHPAWSKVFGDPTEPATAVVFGEKGAGKTALRLQIVRHLRQFNESHPDQRLHVIEYDDFNPFLDRFRSNLPQRYRRPDKLFTQWKLWDHMDAILSIAVTELVDAILHDKAPTNDSLDVSRLKTNKFDQLQSRDVLLLAACYDQSASEPFAVRWYRLRRKLHFHTWRSKGAFALAIVVTLVVIGVLVSQYASQKNWDWLATPWPYVFAAAGWLPWLWRSARRFWLARLITRQLKVVDHDTGRLRRVLMQFTSDELIGQPLPRSQRTDDRYEMLNKYLDILKTLGYSGAFVIIDRVDEPHLVNGSAEQMRALIWPILDNKLLKHSGVGFKLLLPIELVHFVDREDRDFYQRARLDKQNMVRSLEWTGEALFDVANARLGACAADGKTPRLTDLFEDSLTQDRLIDALRGLRVPRHLFKFMYQLLMSHCNAHTDEKPVWKISAATFDSTLALYHRQQDAFDRGMGAG